MNVSVFEDGADGAARRFPSVPEADVRVPPSSRDHAVDEEHDDRADRRADEAGALVGVVPADRLSDPRRDERADDAENAW